MVDLTHPRLPRGGPRASPGTYSPRPLIAVMGLGAILPMSALTFVLLLPQMQDAYQQGLSILALVAVQQLQTGLGPDLVLALVANQTSRTRVLVGAGAFFTAAAAVLWLAGVFPNQILLYAGAIGVVLGGGALDLDPELPPVRLLPGQPATTGDPGPAGGPRVRPHPVPAHGGDPGLRLRLAGVLLRPGCRCPRLRGAGRPPPGPGPCRRPPGRRRRTAPNLRPSRPRCPRPPGSSPPPDPFA